MKGKTFYGLILIALLSLAIGGCGGGSGPASSQTHSVAGNLGTDASGNAYVGANFCINCHNDSNLVPAADYGQVSKYLTSKHALHSTSVTAQSGASCLKCHDPVGDGKALAATGLIPAADVPSQGLAAVTCEACHGGGLQHFAIGAIPDATPDYTVCGKCHNQTMPQTHAAHHPFGLSILENYEAGAHFKSINSSVQSAAGAPVQALCSRCHTDEGFRQFASSTLGQTGAELTASLGAQASLTTVSPVQCRTCHDPHSGALRAQAVTASEGGNPVTEYSASFELCTTCHQVFLTANYDTATNTFNYALDSSKLDQGIHSTINQFADSHFDNPNTATVEGYNINAADDRACLNCHDPHAAAVFPQSDASTIASEWAGTTGGHGDYQSQAFLDPQNAVCAKCHSGSEFVKLTEGLPYSTTNADDSVTYNLSANQARVVGCASCHDLTAKDSSGAFALGPRRIFKTADGTQTTTYTFPSGKSVDLSADPDDMLCITCHSGRESGSAVDAEIAAGPQADGTYKFVDIHHYAAGATFYGDAVKGGYEYPGKSYVGQFIHSPSGLRTCTACHMGDTADHTFIPSYSLCSACHGGSSLDTLEGPPAVLRSNVEALKSQLLTLLTDGGVVYSNSYPYFTNITTPAQLKAAYNWQFADQDPASFVHNGSYIEQLLYDSIADLGGTTSISRP